MRYEIRRYDENYTLVEVGTCVNPDGTLTDRVLCDFPTYGVESLDEGAWLDAQKVCGLLNGIPCEVSNDQS